MDSHAFSNYHRSDVALHITKSSQSERLAILKWLPQATFSSSSNFYLKPLFLLSLFIVTNYVILINLFAYIF